MSLRLPNAWYSACLAVRSSGVLSCLHFPLSDFGGLTARGTHVLVWVQSKHHPLCQASSSSYMFSPCFCEGCLYHVQSAYVGAAPLDTSLMLIAVQQTPFH